MATLLLVTMPFLVAIPAAAKSASVQRYSATVAITAGIGLLLLVGLALNGSLAGWGLALPVVVASALIIVPARSRLRLWVAAAAALFVIGGVVAIERTSIGSGEVGSHADSAVESRAEILRVTGKAIADFMPFGSGLGSFAGVYPLYERPEQVNNVFVVHAHNEYAELVLELGIAGIVLIAAFFLGWAAAVWRVWRTAEAGPYARAAAIASAAILVHSLVDFPARTAAIAACLGLCLALLADGRLAPPKEERELRRRRHREFR
jgi:O-antigen ligase